jgi:hypothetical protein
LSEHLIAFAIEFESLDLDSCYYTAELKSKDMNLPLLLWKVSDRLVYGRSLTKPEKSNYISPLKVTPLRTSLLLESVSSYNQSVNSMQQFKECTKLKKNARLFS